MASRAAQILCLLFVLPFVKPDNPPISDFAHHANLDDSGDFQIFWNYDDENITIQYHAKSQGWAGLGFSPNGAMPGSDIALFWVDNTGQGMVSVSPLVFPLLECSKNWEAFRIDTVLQKMDSRQKTSIKIIF